MAIKNYFIYLCGSIKKSNAVNNNFTWTAENINYISSLATKLHFNLTFLNPASRSDDLSDELSLFGRDMLQVYLSDFLLVDGRDKKGVGVGYEMAFANFKNIPVISWVPYNSHYRPENLIMLGQHLLNWNHPFFKIPSQILAETLDEAVNAIATHALTTSLPLTKDDFVLPAMQHYIGTQLQKDQEMNDLISAHEILKNKVNVIKMCEL